MATRNRDQPKKKRIDVQRRRVVGGSLAVLGTASTGLLAGCGGGSSGGGRVNVTPLTLMWMSPPDGATNATVDTRITLEFSEPVTVGSNAIRVSGPSGVVAIAVTVSGANVTLTPVNPLSAGQKYTITISSGVKSAAANAYAGSAASFITTAQELVAGALVSDSYYAYRWSSPPAQPWHVLQYLTRGPAPAMSTTPVSSPSPARSGPLLAARPGSQVLCGRSSGVFKSGFGSSLDGIRLILLLVGLAGCGGGGSSAPPGPITVSVSPSSATVPIGQPKQFTATVSGTSNMAVAWQINGVNGGNATIGMISSSGLYVGPAAVPGPSTVTVTAVSLADANKSGSASVLVTVPVAVTVGGTVTGKVQTFMSTNFDPKDAFSAAFFTRVPNAAALVGSLHAQHVRIQEIEDAIPQKSPTAWDFSLLDPIVIQLLNTGDQSPEFEIARAPSFMNDSNGNLLPANFQAFADYSANLVKYYNAGGFDVNGTHFQSPSPKHITWWSVYNEPNFPFTPDQYVTLYNLVVPAMKAVDPTIKIVAVQLGDLGGSGRNDWPQIFMPTFVSHVTAPVDAVATHVYSTCDQRDNDQVLFDSVVQFVDHVKFIASSLKANASLANVPVWVTENNINASFSGEGGVAGFTSCNGVMFPYVEDLRGSSAFFAAWRPLVFSRVTQAGAQALYHWFFPASPQNAEYNDNYPPGTEKLLLSYWVDYHLAHYFPSPPGSDILQLSTSDATTVETLATRNPDGSVVVMVVDHAAHSAADDNGAGDPRLVTVDLSALGRFSSGTVLTIDASTDPVNGPAAVAVLPAAQMQVSLGGYGVAFLMLKP